MALVPPPPDCPDLFRQDTVHTYALDIAPADWQSLVGEFNNLTALLSGADFATYHPAVFHMDGETVSDAAVKLHGQSSWADTVTYDGARAKMQFAVSFDQTNKNGNFHGLSKLVFDMPRSDWTFLHDRLAHAWLRQVGVMAPCAASGKLVVNGNLYGLYVVEDGVGGRLVKQYFPDNPGGDLWKAGLRDETNKAAPNWDRKTAFWSASTPSAVAAIVDIPGSLRSWAAEAILNNADGYYNGSHNFYIYDQGQKGFVFLPQDTDSTFDWLAVFESIGANGHPVYWWSDRAKPAPIPGQHWLVVMADPAQRKNYAQAISALLDKWDVGMIQGWIDTWSKQIAADVAADPHAWATPADFQRAVAAARDVTAQRPVYLRSFVDCELGGTGADKDGDGFRWCEDCRDDSASIHPGAAEVCGNGVDDNCNGVIDEGCPTAPHPDAGPVATPDAGTTAAPDAGTIAAPDAGVAARDARAD
jgi:hypothetical protein